MAIKSNIFLEIKTHLGREKVALDLSSIRPHDTKGFMSDIYIANSNLGELIIHVLNPVDEQRKQEVYKKALAVAKLLQKYPAVMSARVLCADELQDGRWFTVQTRLAGSPAGKRILENNVIKDIFCDDKEQILNQVEQMLARLHSIHLKGFGYLNQNMTGRYTSWKEFLQKESQIWLKIIYKNSRDKAALTFISDEEYKQLQKNMDTFFKTNAKLIGCKTASLVHGDMINPGNILVDKGKVTGIIDFEWALAADPAFEFAFTDQYDLKEYFAELKRLHLDVNRNDFLKKIHCYKILWLLWGTNVHAKGDVLKKILFEEFKKTCKHQ